MQLHALFCPALIALLLAATPAAEAQQETPVLVSTAWLAARLGNPDLLVLHVGMGHRGMPGRTIQGAGFLDYHDIAIDAGGLTTELPPIDRLVATFREAGISAVTHVVVYGDPAHLPARVWMTLDYLGHGRKSLLDGGLELWESEGRPVARGAAPAHAGDFEAHVQDDVLVDVDWVRQRT